MADKAKGTGRIYAMVGMMAAVAIPLALFAPGISRQVGQRAEQEERLVPLQRDDDASAAPVTASNGDAPPGDYGPLPVYGEPTGFGEPTIENGSMANLAPTVRNEPGSAASNTSNASPATTAASRAGAGSVNLRDAVSGRPGGQDLLKSLSGRQPTLSGAAAAKSGAEALGLNTRPRTIE